MFSGSRPHALARTALVVDGDRTFRHFALRVAQRLGCNAVGLRDAEEALRWLAQHERDRSTRLAIITMDAKLRAMSGFALCRALRSQQQQQQRTKDVPIVFASSLTELEDNVVALEAGADEFLPKPVQSQLYAEIVERYLTLGRPREITMEVSLDFHVDVQLPSDR